MKEQKRVLSRLAVPEIAAPFAAALDLTPEPGDVGSNLLLAAREIRAAKEAHPGLRWVVLPELISCGYSNLSSVHRYAEHAEDGPSARFFVSLAHELDLHIAYGFPELVREGAVRDSVNLAGSEVVLLTYGKKHLVMEAGEHRFFVAGDGPVVAYAGGLRVALAVCWDLGFPEFVREAAALGADLILAPAGWRDPFGPQYGLACAARALDNGVYVASANQIGAYPEARFGAPGGVYGPDGLRASEHAWGRSVAGIYPDFARSWRTSFGDTLAWSRPGASAGSRRLAEHCGAPAPHEHSRRHRNILGPCRREKLEITADVRAPPRCAKPSKAGWMGTCAPTPSPKLSGPPTHLFI